MRQMPTNFCPLRAIAAIGSSSGPALCIEDRCAWFHIQVDTEYEEADGMCCMIRIAEALATNCQALGNLPKNGLPGATNTEQAEGGTDLTVPDSTSSIHGNGGNVK